MNGSGFQDEAGIVADAGALVGDVLVIGDKRAAVVDVPVAVAVEASPASGKRPVRPAVTFAQAVAALEAHDAEVARLEARAVDLEAVHADLVQRVRADRAAVAGRLVDGETVDAVGPVSTGDDSTRAVLEACDLIKRRLLDLAVDRERLLYERSYAEGSELAAEVDEALARFYVLAPEVAEAVRMVSWGFQRRGQLSDDARAWRDRLARKGEPFFAVPEPSLPVPLGIAFSEFGSQYEYSWAPAMREWQSANAGERNGVIARAVARVRRFLEP